VSVIALLITAGGVVAGGFLAAFAWAVRSGQFDDTHTPAVRMLLDARPIGSDTTGDRQTHRHHPSHTEDPAS
jgi:cbb3-type cytochrome oxidase maturation protein